MKVKSDWAAFLRERHLLILEWVAEGQPFEQIARTLSMDPVQVQLISMTPAESTRVHARRAPRRAKGRRP